MLLKMKGPSYFLRIFSYKMWRGKGIHQGQFVALKIRGCRIAYWGCRKVSNIKGKGAKVQTHTANINFYYYVPIQLLPSLHIGYNHFRVGTKTLSLHPRVANQFSILR